MTQDDVRARVGRLDTSVAADGAEAWDGLRHMGEVVVPYFVEAYPTFKKWQGRTALVFHSIRYARTSDAAFELGVRALSDRSTQVR